MSAIRRNLIGLLAVISIFVLGYVIAMRGISDDGEISAATPVSADVSRAVRNSTTKTGFPEAELRFALTDVCSKASSDSADVARTPDEHQAEFDAFNAKKSALSDRLSASSFPEHLHLAAMLADDPVTRFRFLEDAIAQNSTDPFLLWNAVRICSETVETTPCPLREWERLLLAADGQNSESWIRVAANRYAANEKNAALEAMRYASAAAESRAYWTDMVEMIERGFAAGSDYDFPERASMAFAIASLQLPRYRDYLRMCEDSSVYSADWAYACLAYGERLERQGKTEMGVSISRAIQRLALAGLGESEKVAEIQHREELLREERLVSINKYNSAAARLTVSSPALFSAYLAAIESEGEMLALRRMRVEVERLIEQQPELACDP